MIYNYPYLKNISFLKNFDEINVKEQYVKITILSFDERPIKEIQGQVTGGNISLDGSSGMRRTGNISLIADEQDDNLVNIKTLLSINKKIEILIGFVNTTNQYSDYPILWFPQGVFLIVSSNINHSQNGVSISLTLHDKMALLNGQCGGVIPASVIFHEKEELNENGDVEISQPTIYQIIQQLVNHFGGEQLGKIIIGDIDNKIKKIMKWTGSTPLYLLTIFNDDGSRSYSFDTNYQEVLKNKNKIKNAIIDTYTYGDNIGYILTDFAYPKELIANAGDTVVTILDQIRDTLGNYEYFYDINGNFRFQEIKNYLNSSYSNFLLEEQESGYLVDYNGGKSVYTFEDAKIIQSFSNSPQYQQIKNDFLVWGKRKLTDNNEIPIRYHLTIDSKPTIGNSYEVFFYIDPDDNIKKAKKPYYFEKKVNFPQKGKVKQYYYCRDENKIYEWSAQEKKYKATSYKLKKIVTKDFRTELYLSGVSNQPPGLSNNYYYTELKNEWPKIYDVENGKFFEVEPSDIDFFLDFIDTSGAISELNVQSIGRRTSVLVDDSINCIFEPTSKDLVIIESGTSQTENKKIQCEKRKQNYVLVKSTIYSMLSNGGALRSAYDEIKKELYQYTNYNQQVSLTTLPIYYLEPNVRITIRDKESGIFGDYIIKTISLPLDINGTMSISCTKALERD